MKHWIAVVSRDHAQIAARSGFLQVNHGKAAPLRKTSAGDEVFIYCPRSGMGAGEVLKRVEFRCVVKNDTIYQVEQARASCLSARMFALTPGFGASP